MKKGVQALLSHPYLQSMFPPYRRLMHLSAPLPIGLNQYAKDGVTIQLALAHGEMRTIKEVVARNIIIRKIKSGELYPGVTAIDATSGGTGIGYAGVLQPLGIKLNLIVKSTLPPGKLGRLRMYGEGVEIVLHAGSESTVERARNDATKFGYVLLDQYADEGNPEAHERYTAPELWKLTKGDVAVIVIALGTCGTAIGFSRYFRKRNKGIKIIGVAVNPNQKVPQIPGMRTPEEIERDVRLPREGVCDEVLLALREASVRGARKLMYADPSSPGLSTAAAYKQALEYVRENLKWLQGKRVIVISPDSIDPYVDIMNAEQDDGDVEKAFKMRPLYVPR